MCHRYLVAIGVLAVVIAVGSLALVPVAGQARPARAAGKTGLVPKTPWGEPDLQGIWGDDYQTPLQRPARYAGKEFFTDEERADLDKLRAAVSRFGDRVAPRGTEQDVSGAYDVVFTTVKHTGRRTSLIVDPPDGRIPPLTPEAKKRMDATREFQLALLQATDICKNKLPGCDGGKYGPPSPRRAETPPHYLTWNPVSRSDGPEDRGLRERCMEGMLPDFGNRNIVGFFLQIVQSPGIVSIFYDTGQGQGWHRTILVDGSPHLPPDVRQWWGDSRGRWEGNTLVVDVTNFSPKTDIQGSSENLHLIERWTRIDADTFEYVVTMEDPTTWTRPWTVKQEYTKQGNEFNRIYKEPRCHEGNYGMIGLLAGARADEKAFAEGHGPDPATKCTAGCGSGFDEENTDPLR